MIILLSIIAATRAFPVGLRPSPGISLNRLRSPSCDDPNGCRSLVDIIHSCGATILLCTWVSVHPNIPGPDERWPRITLRRVGLMLATLVAPEAIIAWAWRQRQLAIRLAKDHKGEGWTTTHGFFATMGGFMEYEGNRPIRVLLPEELESYSLTGNGDFPRVSEAEIEDRSKGDALSKGYSVMQIGWFLTQCIARGVQGLPITELELFTVAFVALNFVIYALWWDKPLNVKRGVRVYKKRKTEEPVDDGQVEATVGFWVAFLDALSKLPAAIVHGPDMATDGDLWLLHVILWPVVKPFQIIRGRGGRGGRDDAYENLKRVGTFYPDKWHGDAFRGGLLVMTTALVFGIIHCFGWTFVFPSSTERTLWRVASTFIIGVPIVPLPLSFILGKLRNNYRHFDRLETSFILLSFFLYVLSRLAVLGLSLLCLRSLPPTAYRVVHWTSFIPHV